MSETELQAQLAALRLELAQANRRAEEERAAKELLQTLPILLPRLGARGGSSSESSLPKEHVAAEVVSPTRPFGLLETPSLFQPCEVASQIRRLSQAAPHDGISWGSEADICSLIKFVLTDISTALKLPLSINQELAITLLRPDIWVLHKLGIPVGVVEVKTPSTKKILESRQVAGQLYDYMMRLRSFYGLQAVFGIMTTYCEWRICWLDTTISRQLASTDRISSSVPSAAIYTLHDLLRDDAVDQADQGEEGGEGEDPSPSEQRRIFATPVISYTSEELLPMLASAIQKMANSPRKIVTLLEPDRPYIRLSAEGWTWAKSLPFHRLKPNVFARSSAGSFILLHDLGRGYEGRVWLAATISGATCVIKFSLKEGKQKVLQEERGKWIMVWGINARVASLAGSSALIMPFATPLADGDWEQPEICLLVKDAVKRLLECRVKHEDLSRRHVGIYKGRAVIYDLSRTSDITNEIEAEEQMLAALNIQ